jgi:hypothetical protein
MTKTLEVVNANFSIAPIIGAIEKSKNRFSEESANDIPVPDFIWGLTEHFLVDYAMWINTHYEMSIEIPDITSLPNGSVDILWYNKTGKMLVNIDNSTETKAYYYSDFHNKKNPMKGNVLISKEEIDESLAIRLKKLNE